MLKVTGTWSLSFWLRLLQNETLSDDNTASTMQTLFYKGAYDGSKPNRSPSVWFLPGNGEYDDINDDDDKRKKKNILTLRVSTTKADDLG